MELEVKLYEIEEVPDTFTRQHILSRHSFPYMFYCHHPIFSDLQRVFNLQFSIFFLKAVQCHLFHLGIHLNKKNANARHNNVTYKCLHYRFLPMDHFNMHNGLLYHQILLKSVRCPLWTVSVPFYDQEHLNQYTYHILEHKHCHNQHVWNKNLPFRSEPNGNLTHFLFPNLTP